MTISSIVVTLSGHDIDRRSSLTKQALEQHPQIEIGNASGPHLPCVLETANTADDHALFEWIQNLDGVQQVQVAFVSLETRSLEQKDLHV